MFSQTRGATLVPKLTRLTAEEEQRALNGNYNNKSSKKVENISNLTDEENEAKLDNKKHSDSEHSDHITTSASTNMDENQKGRILCHYSNFNCH